MTTRTPPTTNRITSSLATLALVMLLAILGVLCTFAGPASAAPTQGYDGNGYWIYVCKSADTHGYAPPLNRYFLSDTWSLELGDEPDPMSHWDLFDNCDNWASGTPGQVGIHKIPGTGRVYTVAGCCDPVGGGWTGDDLVTTEGLTLTRAVLDDDLHTYKTAGGSVAIPMAGWLNYHKTRPPSANGDLFRSCSGQGTYFDGLPVRDGFGNIVYKRGDFAPGDTNGEFGWMYGSIQGAGFYATDRRYRDPGDNTWYDNDVSGQMTGSGTHGNPDSTCNFTGNYGNTDYRFDPAYEPHGLSMQLNCGSGRAADIYCRAETEEPSNSAANASTWGIALNSADIYVSDSKNPDVMVLPGGMNTGGAVIPENDMVAGVPVQTMEMLSFVASDGAGIRQVVFKLDGNVVETRNMVCEHVYATPCPGATGSGYHTTQPYDGSPFFFDVTTMQIGSHTATIEVMDGSGRTASSDGLFAIAGPPPPACYDLALNLRSMFTPTDIEGCSETAVSTNIDDDVPSDTVDTSTGIPGAVPAPITGSGIFEYALDVNSSPNERPLAPGNCSLIEHVIKSSSGAAALSPRERNQIVSVTINLQAFATRGDSLGEQRTRMTMDLPSRQSPRYRKALGCPS